MRHLPHYLAAMTRTGAAGIGALLANAGALLMSCAILASLISVVYFSGQKAHEFWPQAMLVLLGFTAVGFHITGAAGACKAWYERRLIGFLFYAVLALLGFGWEINSQLATASSNQGQLSELQRQASWTSNTTRTRAQEAGAKVLEERAQLKTAREALASVSANVNGKVLTSVAEADAIVSQTKANARFWALTNGCTEFKGKSTKTYCETYSQAVGARGALANRVSIERAVTEAEARVATAEAEHAKARTSAEAAPFATSETRADMANFIRLANYVGKQPTEADVLMVQSLIVPIVLGGFLFIGSWVQKAETFNGRPTRPWINIRGYWAFLMNGESPSRYVKGDTIYQHDRGTANALLTALDTFEPRAHALG